VSGDRQRRTGPRIRPAWEAAKRAHARCSGQDAAKRAQAEEWRAQARPFTTTAVLTKTRAGVVIVARTVPPAGPGPQLRRADRDRVVGDTAQTRRAINRNGNWQISGALRCRVMVLPSAG
jgi:hypothetical protein